MLGFCTEFLGIFDQLNDNNWKSGLPKKGAGENSMGPLIFMGPATLQSNCGEYNFNNFKLQTSENYVTHFFVCYTVSE